MRSRGVLCESRLVLRLLLSAGCFPHRTLFRTAIPSVEGPGVLAVVKKTTHRFGIVINQVSGGSGARVYSHAEPRNSWSTGRAVYAANGAAGGSRFRGGPRVSPGVKNVLRAAECGIRGFLVAALGQLDTLVAMRSKGVIPSDTCWEISVMMTPPHLAFFRNLELSGACKLHVPAGTRVADLVEFRHVSGILIDLDIEAPDSLGGLVRGNEIVGGDQVVPVGHIKFGPRSSENPRLRGPHFQSKGSTVARTRVRRAVISRERLERRDCRILQSSSFTDGPAIAIR